jgi:high-affinity iron transporter
MTQRTLAVVVVALSAAVSTVRAADVRGRIEMPEVCSPGVSPAVVILEAKDGERATPAPASRRAEVALVDQRGLQFVPRVQAIVLGQSVRFTNDDAETHNVHAGNVFNQSMAPGQPREFRPTKAGVLPLLCDIHSHMRGYVVVSASPWVEVCKRDGAFRFAGVPDGRYVLHVWHEMGEPLEKEVTVGAATLDLGDIAVRSNWVPPRPGELAPVRPWHVVIDRIGVLLSSSLVEASLPDGAGKAVKLAEDAYWREFEASRMETAVRSHLGLTRTAELEKGFRSIRSAVRDVAAKRREPSTVTAMSRGLLLSLLQTAAELNRKGVTDSAHLHAATAVTAEVPTSTPSDRRRQLEALRKSFARIAELADSPNPEDAASTMTSVYFDGFEPLERFIAAHQPQSVWPLEHQFYRIRGELGGGLKGEALAGQLASLQSEIETAVRQGEAQPAGAFGPAFAASLITIVREGVEVILILAMLIALVAKAGQSRALRAIWAGVALALVASGLTAVALNRMVSSAQGRSREVVEGLVMLAATAILFYVSYWLISQSQAKRWAEFLKRQVRKGTALGGFGTLAATAFLAVYREGAETALMYQAMIGTQAGSRAGLAGLGVGLGAGLVVLGVVALIVRATSVRLPLPLFFKLTGAVLFAMAVVFAGNGVFELQQAGILRQTPLSWLGSGLPSLGLYPNVQAVSVQSVLVGGAVLAILVLVGAHGSSGPADRVKGSRAAGVGA